MRNEDQVERKSLCGLLCGLEVGIARNSDGRSGRLEYDLGRPHKLRHSRRVKRRREGHEELLGEGLSKPCRGKVPVQNVLWFLPRLLIVSVPRPHGQVPQEPNAEEQEVVDYGSQEDQPD